MFCTYCGDLDGAKTGIDHDERDCPYYGSTPEADEDE
jgi:hypothetical protein